MFNLLQILLALLVVSTAPAVAVTPDLMAWAPYTALGAVVLVALTGQMFAGMLSGAARHAENYARALLNSPEAVPAAQAYQAAQHMHATLVQRSALLNILLDLVSFGSLVVVLHVFGLSGWLLTVGGIPPYLDALVMFGLYLAMLCGQWAGTARMSRTLRGGNFSVGSFITFQLRTTGFLLVPFTVMQAAQWALWAYVPAVKYFLESYLFLTMAAEIGAALLIVFFLPVAVRMFLPAKPVTEGPLKERLDLVARRCKTTVDRVYIWRTGSMSIPTAFFIGLLPPFRYVFITDSLLAMLPPEEIDAVYAHELGHARHKHLWQFVVFLVGMHVVLLASVAYFFGGFESAAGGMGAVVSQAGLMIVLLVIVFGWFSRRFERQADFFAARQTSPQAISGALDRIAKSAGDIHYKRGWRHFSIAQRMREVAVLEESSLDAQQQVRMWEGELTRATVIAVVTVLACATALIPFVGDDIASGKGTYPLLMADRIMRDYPENPEAKARATALYAVARDNYDAYLQRGNVEQTVHAGVLMNIAAADWYAAGSTQRFDDLAKFLDAHELPEEQEASLRKVIAASKILKPGDTIEDALKKLK